MTQRIKRRCVVVMIVPILNKIIGVTTNDLSMSEGVLMIFIFSSMQGSDLALIKCESEAQVEKVMRHEMKMASIAVW